MAIPVIAAPTRTKPRRIRKRKQPIAYLFLAPTMISILIISILPIAYTVYIAFTNFDAYHFQNYQFVGLQNFQDIIFGQWLQYFAPVAGWTFVFAIGTTLINYFMGLLLAVFLNNKHMRESNFYRGILIIPWAVPSLISQLAWSGLLDQYNGNINQLLHYFGVGPVPWLVDPFWARISILLVNLWLGFPYMMNVCLGGLQAIPEELYEASAIDGANGRQQFRHVTVPAIWKISIPLIIPSIAFNFNNYNAIYLISQGGPPNPNNPFAGSTDILISVIYNLTKVTSKYEIAAALSVLVFLVVAVFSLINMKLTGSFEEVD